MKKLTIYATLVTLVSLLLSFAFATIAGKDAFVDFIETADESETSKTPNISLDERYRLDELYIKTTKSDVILEKSESNKMEIFQKELYSPGENFKIFKKENGLTIDFTSADTKENNFKFKFLKNGSFGLTYTENEVRIKIPARVKRIVVESMSGNVTVTDLNLDFIHIKSSSGYINSKNSQMVRFLLDTASGDADISGRVNELDVKSNSGDINFVSALASPQTTIETQSGDVKIRFVKKPDIMLSYYSWSGELQQNLAGATSLYASKLENHKIGNGIAVVKISTQSGDAEITDESKETK